MVNLPRVKTSSLKQQFPAVAKLGEWRKATYLLRHKLPSAKIDFDYKRELHDVFVKDPLYDSHQWWNFDIVNLPEALDILGQETKPINVAVLDSGSPDVDNVGYLRSVFDNDRGWDMEDNDSVPIDIPSDNASTTSHGSHVGSTISMLNDGVDGNGFGARVTPLESAMIEVVALPMKPIFLSMGMKMILRQLGHRGQLNQKGSLWRNWMKNSIP